MHHTGSCERSISGDGLVARVCARINRGCKKKGSANGAGHESMPIRHSVCRGRGTSYAIGLAPSTFRFPGGVRVGAYQSTTAMLLNVAKAASNVRLLIHCRYPRHGLFT